MRRVNMRYVLDTGVFVVSREYYPSVFANFWKNMDNAANKGEIISVKEVRRELKKYGGEQEHLLQWVKKHGNIFGEPTRFETDKVMEMFTYPQFQELIKKKQRMTNSLVADPFVIAKAQFFNGTVVTREKFKESGTSIRIPNVCKKLGVRCIDIKEFMEEMEWKF